MRKSFFCLFGIFCLSLAVGCEKSQVRAPRFEPETPALQPEKIKEVDIADVSKSKKSPEQEEAEREHLKTRLENLITEVRELREYLETNPGFLLREMDNALNATERGEGALGSFSDVFVPNAAKALKAGATKKEVNARVERAIRLAQDGKPLSSYLEQLMNEGGPSAVRAYVEEAIKY